VILGLLFLCAILGVIGFILGLYAVINVEAYKKSTHKIEWREFDPDDVTKQKKFSGSEDPFEPDGSKIDEFYEEDGGFAKAMKEIHEDQESTLL